MASKFPEERKVHMRTRKGHDMTWSCEIHGEPISFHCKKHNISICDRCAIKEHCQKPCELDDIGDVILEKQRKLEDKLMEIEETKVHLKNLDSKMQSCATVVINHFKTLNDEVNTKYEAKIQSVKDKELDEIRSINKKADLEIEIINEKADEEKKIINEKADEEIQIINEKREKLIAACSSEAEKQQLHVPIKETQAKLTSDSETIKRAYVKRVEELQNKNKYEADTLDNISCKIERIKQDDKTLVTEAVQIIASLDESLSDNFHQDKVDCIDQIQREVQKVKVFEGTVGGEHYARIDGYIGKWELVKSIDIQSITRPSVCGLISNDEIVVQSIAGDVYVTNINSERTEKVIETDVFENITSCVPVDGSLIACGWRKKKGNSPGGCITLVDRQWKVVGNFTIPRNTSDSFSIVYIDVGRDGMILAGMTKISGQSNIYTISPADGKIVNTIEMRSKAMWSPIQAMSSGNIVVKTDDEKFTVITRSGEEKAVIQCDEWCSSVCRVNKLTDTLYITYMDAEREIYAVDQVSCDGTIEAKRIVEYVMSDRYVPNPCVITPSGNLVGCNGDKLFVYKNTFTV